MAKNDLTALRDHMFEVIERLKANNDPEASACEKIDVDTARAITNAAETILHSAKIEVDFLRLIAKGENLNGVEKAAEKTKFLHTPKQ